MIQVQQKFECGACKRTNILPFLHHVLKVNGGVDEVYEERCGWCDNLVYARIRKVQA